MGRDLSPVQKWILKEGWVRGGIRRWEILVGFFGWEPLPPVPYIRKSRRFSPASIGDRKYRTDFASLGRSLRRLQDRRLMVCHWGAASEPDEWPSWFWEPTDKGIAYLKRYHAILSTDIE